jgi:hypothetical protein
LFSFTACSDTEKPITDGGVIFNHEAASKLTPAQFKKMDIEFFNYFGVKNEFGADREAQIKNRMTRTIKLAEAGFEPAWLALRLYSYPTGGQARFSKSYPKYWHRLKALADAGNASAQCFFGEVFTEYRHMNAVHRKQGYDMPDLPSVETNKSRWAYLQAAAQQGHTYCQNYAAGAAREKGDKQKAYIIKRNCALAGDARCERWVGLSYAMGNHGLPKDQSKSLCWYTKAHLHDESISSLSGMTMARNAFASMYSKTNFLEKVDTFTKTVNSETDCDTVTIK